MRNPAAGLGPAEWLLIGYFVYVALLAPFFPAARVHTVQAWLLAAAVAAACVLLSRVRIAREWAPWLLTLAAYREMDWFTPSVVDHRLDLAFLGWDRWLFGHGLGPAIESPGTVLPAILELSYLLVYGAAPVALWALLKCHGRDRIGRWWIAYLAGTLGVYALLPFFPSQPPRTAFPGQDFPHVTTWLRQLNLSIVGAYGIHSGVFPSAHVSSVFASAWGLLATLPKRPVIGRSMAGYGCAVALAVVYGRYHYAADVLAGFAVSFLGIVALRAFRDRPVR